ncbi:hypothetical protein D8674_039867 [Pyrus ussuriensis x Pyrus communis]|uniref:Uncharacterized protein n=1 Tax=Pyrus ussuriensis x Pyrus communis TaxID=2448454 RepID=A0A5N5H469_9ROSA|nr:hypothetical protein D8674_039867 [Pyrus ussuriensis x Pyrus communis]
MNVLASECSSGCESGWTVYLEHSNYLSRNPSASRSRDNNCKSKSDFCGKQVIHDKEEDDEEEDQSMVSDASSGPPHFNEDEVYLDENNSNNNNYGSFYPPQISKDAGNLKFGRKRQQRNNIKGKGMRSCGDQQQQQPPSLLDDTASSPVFNYSKNNFIVSNNQASGDSVLDYSQGFSSTHFKGRSAYQDHCGFLQSTPSGNNQWFQG